MTLEIDVVERIRADFPSADATIAMNALVNSEKQGRVARCIVQAANGSLHRLRELIDLACRDFRDVILAGEYDNSRNRVRDLQVSFLIATVGDFWICQTAYVLHRQGFKLTSIVSQSATAGPFNSLCDHSEGQAKFSNVDTTIIIQKKNRLWSVTHAVEDLRQFGLNAEFQCEELFHTHLDWWMLQRH